MSVSRNTVEFDLGPDFSGGPEGPDRSLLAHCLTLADPNAWALEFGTGKGETAAMIGQVIPVITFDSFEGLPEDWRPEFRRGHFGDIDMPWGIPGVTVVKGWFADTIGGEHGYEWPEKVSLVHFDADLYSSTSLALTAMGHLIKPGTIVVFDEFFGYEGCENHEQRAWFEWAAQVRLNEVEVIGHGREQWAVRVTERAL